MLWKRQGYRRETGQWQNKLVPNSCGFHPLLSNHRDYSQKNNRSENGNGSAIFIRARLGDGDRPRWELPSARPWVHRTEEETGACEIGYGSEDLARPERFELPTYSSGGCRSIQLSYGRA